MLRTHSFAPLLADITYDGTGRDIAVADEGCKIDCTSDVTVTLTVPADLPRGVTVLITRSGDGDVQLQEGSGATLVCGLDQEGALHRKVAYKYAAITLWIKENPDGESALGVIWGATSP